MREGRIWVADCETDPFDGENVPQPFIWGCYNGAEYHEFKETADFMGFITEQEGIVYAHNGGKFDWFYIFDYLEKHNPITVISGRLAKFNIGKMEFRDSYNILPVPLATFNKDDFDYSLLTKKNRKVKANYIKIQKYLRSDCINLFDAVSLFVNDHGVSLTVAGAAMKKWEKMGLVEKPETDRQFYDDIAPYYYGGRVECFKTGEIFDDFQVVDINSAYPYEMLKNHPYGNTLFRSAELPKNTGHLERSFIKLKCVAKGCFPFRHDDKKTSYPSDDVKRTYFVTGWEYIAAIETARIEEIEIMEVTQLGGIINFTPYVEHFSSIKISAKLAGDSGRVTIAKLFLNALYGKYATDISKYKDYTVIDPVDVDQAEIQDDYKPVELLGVDTLLVSRSANQAEGYYNPAVAASITGAVRAHMMRSLDSCEGLIYCDTDSIAAHKIRGLAMDKTRLGAWDLEAECSGGGVGGKKMYAFRKRQGTYIKDSNKRTNSNEWKLACKGARLDYAEIMEVCRGKTVTYHPEAPTYSLSRGVEFVDRKIKPTF